MFLPPYGDFRACARPVPLRAIELVDAIDAGWLAGLRATRIQQYRQ